VTYYDLTVVFILDRHQNQEGEQGKYDDEGEEVRGRRRGKDKIKKSTMDDRGMEDGKPHDVKV
jgi:hypothetical protein